MITISVIKADVGGYVGHSSMHPDLLAEAQELLTQAKQAGTLVDFYVAHCGDDLFLIMTHERGELDEEVHKLAWDIFLAGTEVAKKLKLYGAGQDLLSDAFSGNIRGMGPGSAEMEIEERTSEPIIVFMGDKTSAGSFNLPLYKMFGDPFNTVGLVIAEPLHEGFTFEVHDVINHQKIRFDCPEELYDLLVFLGSPSRFCVKAVYSRNTGEIGAVSSTDKLALIAGRYVGKDDPPCVACLGFQLANGILIGPRDMFDDPGFDEARHQANLIADYLRRHGPWEPHRLPLEEMEYTTMPAVAKKLAGRWEPIE